MIRRFSIQSFPKLNGIIFIKIPNLISKYFCTTKYVYLSLRDVSRIVDKNEFDVNINIALFDETSFY